MTCIVGLVHSGAVWMGADSAGVSAPFNLLQIGATKTKAGGEA